MELSNAERFFATARERYLIKLKKDTGQEPPWTDDPIFQSWFFCNVHREDDKTTVWFRENVRSKLTGLDLLRATIIFRWFNRIEVCEKILDLILGEWSSEEAQKRLKYARHVVTGAFMVRTPEGMDKLTGILYCIDRALPLLPEILDKFDPESLERSWELVKDTIYGLGPFMAYEIITDLRWTHLLQNAKDINTWANSGPGCARGLSMMVFNTRKGFDRYYDQNPMLKIMKFLLKTSQDKDFWPFPEKPWEMREVEHWSCEYAKYCSALEGRKLKRHYNYLNGRRTRNR